MEKVNFVNYKMIMNDKNKIKNVDFFGFGTTVLQHFFTPNANPSSKMASSYQKWVKKLDFRSKLGGVGKYGLRGPGAPGEPQGPQKSNLIEFLEKSEN